MKKENIILRSDMLKCMLCADPGSPTKMQLPPVYLRKIHAPAVLPHVKQRVCAPMKCP